MKMQQRPDFLVAPPAVVRAIAETPRVEPTFTGKPWLLLRKRPVDERLMDLSMHRTSLPSRKSTHERPL
jgi:hypothetical protein